MTVDDKLDIAKTSKDLGNWYNTNANYEQALEEYKNEAKAYFELGNKLENAKAHRMIGEMYMLLSNFSNALKHAEIYLGVVTLKFLFYYYYLSAIWPKFILVLSINYT